MCDNLYQMTEFGEIASSVFEADKELDCKLGLLCTDEQVNTRLHLQGHGI